MNGKIEDSGIDRFVLRCLLDSYNPAIKQKTIELWKKAASEMEFVEFVLNCKELKMSQGYAVLSRMNEGHWYRVREMLGNNVHKTYSDAGSIKVGNELGNILISTNGGDGKSRVAVISEKDFNSNMMDYCGIMLEGKYNIYSYDCGNEPIIILDGKYQVFNYEGIVAFVEI